VHCEVLRSARALSPGGGGHLGTGSQVTHAMFGFSGGSAIFCVHVCVVTLHVASSFFAVTGG